MIILNAILPLLFSFILINPGELKLQQDIQKDITKLRQNKQYFISDNTSETASLQSIVSDLQVFGLASGLDLSKAKYSRQQAVQHQVQQWHFTEGEIKRITQLESIIALDTMVTQRYLENRPPTQHRIQNNFTFRVYQIDTASEPAKLYYLTEVDQGLLMYRLGKKEAQISYLSPKNGLNHLLPVYQEKAKKLLDGVVK